MTNAVGLLALDVQEQRLDGMGSSAVASASRTAHAGMPARKIYAAPGTRRGSDGNTSAPSPRPRVGQSAGQYHGQAAGLVVLVRRSPWPQHAGSYIGADSQRLARRTAAAQACTRTKTTPHASHIECTRARKLRRLGRCHTGVYRLVSSPVLRGNTDVVLLGHVYSALTAGISVLLPP